MVRPARVGQIAKVPSSSSGTCSGTPIVAAPADDAEATPGGESSIATQSAGSTPRSSVARR